MRSGFFKYSVAASIDTTLSTYDATVRRNFQGWVMKHHAGAGVKFNEVQMQWLQMIRGHVITSFISSGMTSKSRLLGSERCTSCLERIWMD
jgi:hypothetical protein